MELLEVLERKGRHISSGLVIIGFDNRKVYQKIVEEVTKASNYAQDVGTGIVQIQRVIKSISYDIEGISERTSKGFRFVHSNAIKIPDSGI